MTTPPAEVVASDLNHMLDQGVEICVMEVSSHALSQDRLFGLKFSVAAWTNLTPEHLDFHGSMEAYAAAKARLFHEFCDVRENWVLNLDDPKVAQFAELGAFTFSQGEGHRDATIRVKARVFYKNRTCCELHVGIGSLMSSLRLLALLIFKNWQQRLVWSRVWAFHSIRRWNWFLNSPVFLDEWSWSVVTTSRWLLLIMLTRPTPFARR